MLSPKNRDTMSWALGMVLSVVLAVMFWRTLEEGFAISRTVMIGSILLIAVLMYGPEVLYKVAEIIRGGGRE